MNVPDWVAVRDGASVEGVPPVGWYGCTVGCEEVVAGALLAPWDEPSGKHAEVRTGVDQESDVAASVCDV